MLYYLTKAVQNDVDYEEYVQNSANLKLAKYIVYYDLNKNMMNYSILDSCLFVQCGTCMLYVDR